MKILMNHTFDNKRLEIVRDLFIFAAFTGLSYIDIKTLTADEIITSADGAKWIKTRREKTKTPVIVKLLDIPLLIIEKYKLARIGGFIFTVPRNDICNLRLKDIAKECGIKHYLTFHQSRHTFGTLLLSAGIPIESISKMMGHTNISTTQTYAKVTDDKISEDMDKLIERRKMMQNNATQTMQL